MQVPLRGGMPGEPAHLVWNTTKHFELVESDVSADSSVGFKAFDDATKRPILPELGWGYGTHVFSPIPISAAFLIHKPKPIPMANVISFPIAKMLVNRKRFALREGIGHGA